MKNLSSLLEGSTETVVGKILLLLFVVLALIIPGASYLYVSDQTTFNTIDLVRLGMISIFYSLPLILLSTLYTLVEELRDRLKGEKKATFSMLVILSIFSTLAFYYATLGIIILNGEWSIQLSIYFSYGLAFLATVYSAISYAVVYHRYNKRHKK